MIVSRILRSPSKDALRSSNSPARAYRERRGHAWIARGSDRYGPATVDFPDLNRFALANLVTVHFYGLLRARPMLRSVIRIPRLGL